MDIKEKDLEKNENLKTEDLIVAPSKEFVPVKEKKKSTLSIFSMLVLIVIIILAICFAYAVSQLNKLSAFLYFKFWEVNNE